MRGIGAGETWGLATRQGSPVGCDGWTGMMSQTQWPFELDRPLETGVLPAQGEGPLVIEAFRTTASALTQDA